MINLRSREIFCTVRSGCIFHKDLHDFKFSNLETTFPLWDILGSIRPQSLFPEIFGGPKCKRMSKNLSSFVTFAQDLRALGIVHMDFYNHCMFHVVCGLQFLWTSLWTYHYRIHLTTSLLWRINLHRWRILFSARRCLQVKSQQDSFLITYIVIMAYYMISCQIEEVSLYASFGDYSLKY